MVDKSNRELYYRSNSLDRTALNMTSQILGQNIASNSNTGPLGQSILEEATVDQLCDNSSSFQSNAVTVEINSQEKIKMLPESLQLSYTELSSLGVRKIKLIRTGKYWSIQGQDVSTGPYKLPNSNRRWGYNSIQQQANRRHIGKMNALPQVTTTGNSEKSPIRPMDSIEQYVQAVLGEYKRGNADVSCNQCGAVFRVEVNEKQETARILNHIYSHLALRRISCKFCVYSALTQFDIQHHLKYIHGQAYIRNSYNIKRGNRRDEIITMIDQCFKKPQMDMNIVCQESST